MNRVIVENIEDLNSSSSTVSVSNIDKCNTDNITGSVNVSNQISGYASEITDTLQRLQLIVLILILKILIIN